jgi:hypothetical protein
MLWGSIMLYIDKMEFENDELSEEVLYSIGKGISSVWLVSVSVFFVYCDKNFVKSFVGTSTAKEYAKECFDWQRGQEVADEVIVKVSLPSISIL